MSLPLFSLSRRFVRAAGRVLVSRTKAYALSLLGTGCIIEASEPPTIVYGAVCRVRPPASPLCSFLHAAPRAGHSDLSRISAAHLRPMKGETRPLSCDRTPGLAPRVGSRFLARGVVARLLLFVAFAFAASLAIEVLPVQEIYTPTLGVRERL
ncbi:hypothetical protein MRX96_006569 [Rhipicephalus microplus]